MNLRDLKDKQIKYDWKTIFVGVQKGFFSKEIIADYAVELLVFDQQHI